MQSAEELELGSPTEKRHLPSAEQGSSRGETKMTDTIGIEGCSSEAHSADAAEDSMGCHGLDDQVSGEAGVQGFAICDMLSSQMQLAALCWKAAVRAFGLLP